MRQNKDDEPQVPADTGLDMAMTAFEGLDEAAPAPSPDPAPEDEPAGGSPLADFEMPGAAPKLEDPPPPPAPPANDIAGIPDHVVRKGEAAITGWKQLRAELEAERKAKADIDRDRELKDLRIKELEEQIAKVPKQEELEAARKRAAELEDTLGQIEITRSERFKELYDKPINEVFGKVVRQFIKGGATQEQAIAKARSVFKPGMQDPQALSAALEDESSLVVGAVSALLDEREVLAQRRDEAIQNWQQERAAGEQDRIRRDAATISDQLTKAAESGFSRAVKEGSFLFQEGADPKWNEGVKTRRDAVMGFIRGGRPDELAYLVAEGVASPVYRNAYARVKAENEDLKAQLAAISGVRPGTGAGSRPAAAVPASSPPVPATANEFIDLTWNDE